MNNTAAIDQVQTQIPPIVVDLGKTKAKRIKQLKKGKGPLLSEVNEAVASARQQLGDELAGKDLLPIVLVYRKRPKRSSRKLSVLNPFSS